MCICLWVHYLYLFIYLFAGYIYRMGSAMRQPRHCSLQIARRAHWRQHRGLGQDHPPGGIQCIQPTCFSFGGDAFLERCFKPKSSGQGSTKASCSASSLSASFIFHVSHAIIRRRGRVRKSIARGTSPRGAKKTIWFIKTLC